MCHCIGPDCRGMHDHLIRILTSGKLQNVDLSIYLLFQPDDTAWLMAFATIIGCCRPYGHRNNGSIESFQCFLDTMLGCCGTCRIGIQCKRHLFGEFFQLLNVLLCNGTANTGNCLLCPKLMGNHRIDVSLYDHNLLRLLDRITSHIQGIQDAVLLKQRRLRRIKVFWLTVAQGTPTKADDPTAPVPNREYQTMPKVIIDPTTTNYALIAPA